MSIAVSNPLPEFLAEHPYRLDLSGDSHVRFRDLVGAARSAIFHRTGIWDEKHQRGYSLQDCIRMAAMAERGTGVM